MDFNDKINDKTKGISIESMDFDNPNVYGDTSISDGIVFLRFLITSDLYFYSFIIQTRLFNNREAD